MKVLLVEDSVFYQKIFINVFEKNNIDHEICEHGCYALEALAESEFDYIFLDLKLPDMNGSEIYTEYLQNSDSIIIPITGYQEELAESLALFDQYLLKPFGEEEILACIGDLGEPNNTQVQKSDVHAVIEGRRFLLNFCQTMGYTLSNQLLDNFTETLNTEIPMLHRLYSQGHLYQVENTVHQVKSNARYFGFKQFADICESIETTIISGPNPTIPNQINTLLDMTGDLHETIKWAKTKLSTAA